MTSPTVHTLLSEIEIIIIIEIIHSITLGAEQSMVIAKVLR